MQYAKIKAIKPIGKRDVYNMEVDKYHNFSIEDGLIVHNCIDSLRYALNDEIMVKRGWGFAKNNRRF